MDAFSPIKDKCTWWRESLLEEDSHNPRLAHEDVRVRCTCFVEGYYWLHRRADVPADCPEARHCRYYIRSG